MTIEEDTIWTLPELSKILEDLQTSNSILQMVAHAEVSAHGGTGNQVNSFGSKYIGSGLNVAGAIFRGWQTEGTISQKFGVTTNELAKLGVVSSVAGGMVLTVVGVGGAASAEAIVTAGILASLLKISMDQTEELTGVNFIELPSVFTQAILSPSNQQHNYTPDSQISGAGVLEKTWRDGDGNDHKVVYDSKDHHTTRYIEGEVVSKTITDSFGNLVSVLVNQNDYSLEYNFETGIYKINDGLNEYLGNITDGSISPTADNIINNIVNSLNNNFQNISPEFDIFDHVPVVTALSNGWTKIETNVDITYSKGGFTYTQNSSGNFEINSKGVNAFYTTDGTQVVGYRDSTTGAAYVLKIAPNGTKTFSYTGEPGKEFQFNNVAELPDSVKGAVQSFQIGLSSAVGNHVNDLFSDNPSLATTSDYAKLNSQDMSLVPPLPGHKPDVPVGGEAFSTKNGSTYDLNDEVTVTIGGQDYHLQRFSSLVDVDNFSNTQLIEMVGGSLGGRALLSKDTRFQAMSELLERWGDNPSALLAQNVGFIDHTNGGATGKVLVVGAQHVGAVTFVEKGNFKVQFLEAIGQNNKPDIVQVVTEDLSGNKGARSDVLEVIYPENFAFGYFGGYFGGLLATELADSSVFKQVLYNALFTTAGETMGTFIDFLSAGTLVKAATFASTEGMDTSVLNDLPDLAERFAGALSTALSSVIAKAIVSELTDAVKIEGIGGEIFETALNTFTTGVIHEGLDIVFRGADGGVYYNLFKNGFDYKISVDLPGGGTKTVPISQEIKLSIANALASYAGSRLAGEVIAPESKDAAIMGSVGSAIASYFGASSIATLLGNSVWFGPVGVAIAAFLGTVGGTILGNLFGGDEQPKPEAYAKIDYDAVTGVYRLGLTNGFEGGDSEVSATMAQSVINLVNHVLELTHGGLRTISAAPQLSIGFEENQFFVAGFGSTYDRSYFDRSGDAIEHAALKLLKDFDLVGGHAIMMRAWNNTEATTLQEFQQDISVAEAFQVYLLNPTAVLALMMNAPQSESAQQWAAILQRAAELQLHLPQDSDLDGGWGELLAARGDINPEVIPTLVGNNIIVTDPVTGQQILIEHVIGPGYEFVIKEGTDGNDTIQIVIDGPSITYTDAGPGDDTFVGSSGADVFIGGVGNDTGSGGAGNDWLYGGNGDDELYGEAGEDLVVGGAGDDILSGGPDTDMVFGGAGNDTIYAAGGKDSIYGGEGNDIVHADFGDSRVTAYGGSGNDTMYGYGGSTSVNGGIGDDTYILSSPNSALPGNFVRIGRGDGNDYVDANNALQNVYVTFDESIGTNELWFSQSGNNLKITVIGENQSVIIKDWWTNATVRSKVFIDSVHQEIPELELYASGNPEHVVIFSFRMYATPTTIQSTYGSQAQPSGPTNLINNYTVNLANIWEMMSGSYSYDTGGFVDYDSVPLAENGFLYGSLAPKLIIGNDTQYANYTRPMWSQNPFIYMGSSTNDADIRGADLDDKMYGGSGDDYLDGLGGDDIISGGSGNDVIYGGDGNDRLYAGVGDDRIHDYHGDNTIFAGDGNDSVVGGQGTDVIYGEAGNDVIDSGAFSDIISGGDGNDSIFGGEDNDRINGDSGNDRIYGETGDDWLDGGSGNDIISGNTGNDVLLGGQGADKLHGGEGADTLSGGLGIDILYGDAGNDTLKGDEGRDTLYGGAGNDSLSGGSGSDRFVISAEANAVDTIIDFNMAEAEEVIDLTAFGGVAVDFATFAQGFVQNGANTEISLANGQKIILSNTQKTALTATHFLGITPVTNSAPTSSNTSAAVAGGQTVILTSSMLSGTDSDTSANMLRYAVVALALNGVLKLDGTALAAEDSFTMQDILDGKLAFQANSGFTGRNEFEFILSDGINALDRASFYIASNAVTGTTGHNTGGYEGALNGTLNADLMHGLAGTDSFVSGAGDDVIYGDAGVTWVYAQAGNDIVYGSSGGEATFGRSEIYGYEGDDRLFGASGVDTISGDAGNDFISGGAGNDDLYGGSGNDIYFYDLGDGIDTIYDGSGELDQIEFGKNISRDTIAITSTVAGHVEITFTNSPGDKLIIANYINDSNMDRRIEKIIFNDGTVMQVPFATSEGGQTVYGDWESNVIDSGEGNDVIYGQAGNDLIYAGEGNDTVYTDRGHDTVYAGNGADFIEGMWGNDSLYGEGGNDYINGATGHDSLYGGAGDDTLLGADGSDTLVGGTGNDSLQGGEDNDTYVFNGSDGIDTVVDSGGIDKLILGTGIDLDEISLTNTGTFNLDMTFSGLPGDKIIFSDFRNGSSHKIERIIFGSGQEYLFPVIGTSAGETLQGTVGNDAISALDGNDTIQTLAGNDLIYAGNGNDIIQSGEGNDKVFGGLGQDTLQGDIGNDDLNGGEGDDVYLYSGEFGQDTIIDQSGRADIIQFGSGILSTNVVVTNNGNDTAITFTGAPDKKITILGQNAADTTKIELLKFSDGSTITLSAVQNTAPIAKPDAFSGDIGTTISGNVLSDNGNGIDSDGDGDALTVQPGTITTMQGGSVTIHSDGSFSYSPSANYQGSDSFIYTLIDAYGGSAIGTVDLTVSALNDLPILSNIGTSLTWGSELTLTTVMLSAVDTDNTAEELTFTLVGQPAYGILKLNNTPVAANGVFTAQDIINGNVKYTTVDYAGVHSFNFTLSDGVNMLSQAAFNINININAISGTSIGDTLHGTSGNDLIQAHAGNDVIHTYNGNDVIYAGAGADTINSSSYTYTGNKIIYGEDGDDSINAGAGNDRIYGGLGIDNISGHGGNDAVYGGGGNDWIHGEAGDDTLYGEDGDDNMYGHIGHDKLYGGSGNDVMYGMHSVSQSAMTSIYGAHTILTKELYGGDGNDMLYGGQAGDLLQGDNGNDNLFGDLGRDVFVQNKEANATDTIIDFSISSNEQIDLAAFSSSFSSFNQLSAGITQAGANTHVNLGDGQKIVLNNVTASQLTAYNFSGIWATSLMPTLTNAGGSITENNNLTLTTAMLNAVDADNTSSQLIFTVISLPANGMLKLAGISLGLSDTFTAADISGGQVTYVPTADYAGNDSFGFVLGDGVNVTGSQNFSLSVTPHYVTINGTSGADTLNGSGVKDKIFGLAGGDTLSGGSNHDIISGGLDGDTVYGGSGNDIIYSIRVATSEADLRSGYTSGQLNNQRDYLYGEDGDDIIYSQISSNMMDGGNGNDILYGGSFTDGYLLSQGHDIIDDEGHMNYAASGYTGGTDYLYSSTLGYSYSSVKFTKTGNHENLFLWFSNDITVEVIDHYVDTRNIIEYLYDGTASYSLISLNVDINGTSGADTLNGFNSNVIGDDVIKGNDGNDTISGKGGIDYLYGGNGADTFMFEDVSAYNGKDTVFDFSKTQSDKIDIGDLLGAYNPVQHAINNFVSISSSGGNTTISVDKDGVGSTYTSQNVVTINGQTWTNLSDMISSGHLVID